MGVNFRYIFEKKGAIAPKNILENDLWVDVGNIEKDGVFDHHQDGTYASAFECVMKRTDCYERINSYLNAEHDNSEVVIHVHELPDIDCLFCIYAIRRMIQEKKANPAEAFDENLSKKLMEYVNEIDSGRGKKLSIITLYAYYCKIGMGIEDLQQRSLEYVHEGLKLLELVVKKLEKNTEDINLFETPLEDYIDVSTLKYYSELQKYLEIINANYLKDKNENRVILKSVDLWNSTTDKMQPVKAAIWEKLPSGEDEYNFARDEDNCLLTVYPYKIKEENSLEGVTSVIIALNPNMPEAENYSLIPLVEIIEQSEQTEEELFYEQIRRYRRNHSQSRCQSPQEDGRFDEVPFSETSDPWYFSAKGDIIDSPRVGSIIPYSRILSIIENGSYFTERASIIHFKENDGKIDIEEPANLGKISFGELYRETRKKIGELNKGEGINHLFAFVKIHPSMLGYSNNWLRACCLNMVGKSDTIFTKDNILQIDYRTCLYTDQTITVLVAIDRRNQSLDGLINEDKLEESQLCTDLKNLLEHQSELRRIGVSLSETIQKINQESKEIDSFNGKLVHLNTRMEEDDLITNPIEQEVYSFIKNAFGIESLKNSVITSAQLLIKNAEQIHDKKAAERDGRIQAGIGLVTIFAVFSAWVDAYDFIAKFLPGSEGGWSSIFSYRPLLVIEIVVQIIILVLGFFAGKYVLQAWIGSTDKKEKRRCDDEYNK